MNDSDTIKITIKFFAGLREFGSIKEEIEIPKNSDLNYIIEKYEIPLSRKKIIILINGIPQHSKDFKFNEGDIVAVFPPIAGG
ncbi:MAG: MoaD/ThiS family protein [Candidatus Thorarchaeota archaeon]